MTAAIARQDNQPISIGEEVFHKLWVLVVAGIPTGVVVAGIGSRLAMFLLRLTSPDSVRGVTSDDGFEIGRITLGGTYALLVLGAVVGLIGAAAYRAVAPWLLGPSWFRRFTVAAASGAVVGSMLVHEDGIDFRFLKPLWLAIGLFVALPALFGAAIATAVDRIDRRPIPNGRLRWVIPVLLMGAFPLTIPWVLGAVVVLAAWVSIRRELVSSNGMPKLGAVVIRAVWLAIAVLGLVALIRDVQALA